MRLRINKILKLFTDGSVNPQSNIGYGAYLVILDDDVVNDIKINRFINTSSTKLELEVLLWALSDIEINGSKITIYTDCQNIIGLHSRRDRLEQNSYKSKKNKYIKNYKLYQEFYRVFDQLDYEFIKVKGHKKSNQKDDIDRLFTMVDRASRDALRSGNRVSI